MLAVSIKKLGTISIIFIFIIVLAAQLTGCAENGDAYTPQPIESFTATPSLEVIEEPSPSPILLPTPQVIAVQSISLNHSKISINVGASVKLTATIKPSDASDKSVVWASTDKYTAKVVSGTVIGIAAGTCVIRAKASDGSVASCTITVTAPVPSPTPRPAKTFYGSVFDGCSQVIVVTADSLSSTTGKLKAYQKTSSGWSVVISTDYVCLGKNGLVYDKDRVEGQLQTPIGVYSMPYAFGINSKPSGVSLPYYPISPDTYFDGRYDSSTYDKLIAFEGTPTDVQLEKMYCIPVYNYGLLINFNPEAVVGKGNAIFLHCYRTSTSPTAGCVAVSESKMISLLKWIKPSQKPLIIICLTSELSKYYK